MFKGIRKLCPTRSNSATGRGSAGSGGTGWNRIKKSIHDPFQEIIFKLLKIANYEGLPPTALEDVQWCIAKLRAMQCEADYVNALRRKKERDKNKLESVVKVLLKKESKTSVAKFINTEFLVDNNLLTRIEEEDVKNKRKVSSRKYTPSTLEWVKTFFVTKISSSKLKSLEAIFNNLNWNVDVFSLNGFTSGRPLTCVTYAIFDQRRLFELCNIDHKVMARFLMKVEDSYNSSLPYHNSIHAADVVISAHHLLSSPSVKDKVTDFEVFATLVACAVHDVEHLGLSNNFLINTRHELSKLYMDDSIMEAHHYAKTCQIIQQEEFDISHGMNTHLRRHFFFMLKNIILGTDMTKHENHITDLKIINEEKLGSQFVLSKDKLKRIRFFNSLVHVCDLGNPTKPYKLYEVWTERVFAEFFRQGQFESSMGLEISPMCDEKSTNIVSCQIGFIEYLVMPLYKAWADVVHPDAHDIMSSIDANVKQLKSKNPERSPSCSDTSSYKSDLGCPIIAYDT